jgi:hypothetical protein
MTRLTWRPGKTRSKTWLQPVDFFFFTKTTSFWFFKKIKNWFRRPSDPVKTRTRILDRAGSKNYDLLGLIPFGGIILVICLLFCGISLE